MERDVPLTRRGFLAATLGLGIARPTPAADERRLVLVAIAASSVNALSPQDVRRLYLGIPLMQAGHEIVPLRNGADPAAREMFLQRVLFMSDQAYERQLSAQVYRSGGNRIAEFTTQKALLAALAADPWSVSYMQADAARRESALRIVSEL